jgi:aminopeptidase N
MFNARTKNSKQILFGVFIGVNSIWLTVADKINIIQWFGIFLIAQNKNMSTRFSLFTAIVVSMLLPGYSPAQDGYPRNPDVDILHYGFTIYLNDSTNRIEGSAEITCSLTRKPKFLELDLTSLNNKGSGMLVDRISDGPAQLTFRHENNRIRIAIPDTVQETFTFAVAYSGVPADGLVISNNKFGERTFFGDNWPDRARNWLPCLDHPSDKARVDFFISAPAKYTVVSNGLLVGSWPDVSGPGKGNRVTHWKEDVPVPTKVMVIGCADFAWETAGWTKNIPVQTWVFAKDKLNGFIDYKPAVGIMTYFQDLLGPYSFEKLANVQSRTMFGGMENSGCIFYYEESVTGKNQLQGLLAHEIAHQWFGDAVTENDWYHIWLSEGFATYLGACYADSLIPGQKLENAMAEMRQSVIRYYDQTHKPVIDTTVRNYMDLLSTNSYQKGAWVLHLLRQELGEQVFWTGIRTFYNAFRDKNAATSDFQSVMENVSGRSLAAFFHQWLEIPGQPEIRWTWAYDEKNGRVNIEVMQVQEPFDFAFTLPVEITCASPDKGKSKTVCSKLYQVAISQKKVSLSLPAESPVTGVRLDPGCQLLFQEKMTGR